MEENLLHLYDDIKSSTQNIDDILGILENITGPTITCGSGGSKVVAEFINLVLTKKNRCLSITVEPRDTNYLDLSLFNNIIVASHSGSNFGAKVALDKNLNKYLLSTRKTKINDEKLLHYDMENRKSFISLNQTIIPMAIMLKYYLDDDFSTIIDEIFSRIDYDMNLEVERIINIFSGNDSKTVETFLDSTIAEANLGIPFINSKYDYCHGRSTSNIEHDNSAIYIENTEKELDKEIKKTLDYSMKNHLILKGISEDEVINNFFLTLQAMYLCANIARAKKIDLSHVKYDRPVVKSLYYFKGSM